MFSSPHNAALKNSLKTKKPSAEGHFKISGFHHFYYSERKFIFIFSSIYGFMDLGYGYVCHISACVCFRFESLFHSPDLAGGLAIQTCQ